MRLLRRQGGFTLVELLVVILILAVLMAIALPLYLRAVRDSERQTCRSNMQTLATAEQAYRVRSSGHVYTTNLQALVIDPTTSQPGDLQAVPTCPSDDGTLVGDHYAVALNTDVASGEVTSLTVSCLVNTNHGTFTPGLDSE